MRKGQIEMAAVVQVIIASAILLLLFGITYLYLRTAGEQEVKEECSLNARLQILSQVGGLNSPLDLVCPRKFIQIKDTEATETYLKHVNLLERIGVEERYGYVWAKRKTEEPADQTTPDDDTSVLGGERTEAEEAIGEYLDTVGKLVQVEHHFSDRISSDPTDFQLDLKRIFSYELVECWDTFFRGRKDILNEASWYARTNTCVICAEIQLERTANFHYQLTLLQYLRSNPHHYYDGGADYYIYDFLYGLDPPSFSQQCIKDVGIGENLYTEVANGEHYAVVFMRRGSQLKSGRLWVNDLFRILQDTLPWQRNDPFNWFVNPVDPENTITQCQAVALMNLKDVPQYCDVVVN